MISGIIQKTNISELYIYIFSWYLLQVSDNGQIGGRIQDFQVRGGGLKILPKLPQFKFTYWRQGSDIYIQLLSQRAEPHIIKTYI